MASNVEILSALIAAKNEEIRIVKAANAPTMKDDLESLMAEFLALKIQYKDTTGEEFGGMIGTEADIVAASIAAKGEEIRIVKAAKAPTMKEDLAPLIADLLTLKIQYKNLTGEEFGGAQPEKKEKEKAPVQEKKSEGPSKTELNKLKKKEQKLAKRAEERGEAGADAPSSGADAASAAPASTGDDAFAHLYGDSPMVQSSFMSEKVYQQIHQITEDMAGQKIWLRARVSTSRAVGKGVFFVFRQTVNTLQGVMFQGPEIPKQMVKYGCAISLESVVDVQAEVTIPQTPIQGATVKNLELSIVEIHVISRAQELPFNVEDAGRSAESAAETGLPVVNQDTALNYRWVDTRTPANQAIFRIQSGVCQLFRQFLIDRDFVEIHTPKLIGGASEGGSNVFKLQYFNQPACLAQSPQLYKQMSAACGGFERVFEIGPVFRAEDSNTHRHLCEFTGLDFEMAIYEHYYEVLDVMGGLFTYIFDGIADQYKHELNLIAQQYPVEPLKYLRPTLRLTFEEGIQMLNDSGIPASPHEDISTPHEKILGRLVAEKYNTDFYIMDKYPIGARPFYTMPDPHDPRWTNSYDLFIRGEEIVSGAQRVHDVDLLVKRATECGIPIPSIQSYIDAFKHGALPHGGGGIGLERVVMLYLGLKNIRKTSMFPRDPSRLAP